MILWISSYPKSGNTWARIFLSNYIFETNSDPFHNLKYITNFPRKSHFDFLNQEEEKTLNDKHNNYKFYTLAQDKINSNGRLNFIKTHSYAGSLSNYKFTDNLNTCGLIYLVRDPRSVAISLSHHLNLSIEKTVDIMIDKNRFMQESPELKTFWSSWKINYLSWKRIKYPKLIIKYEDLKLNSENKFKEILIFVSKFKNININDNKISKINEYCKFANLKSFEKKHGFNENKGGDFFFRKSKTDEWKEGLNLVLRNKIEEEFKDEMLELGYL